MDAVDLTAFAVALRAARARKGISPEALAELSGTSNKTIRDLERGGTRSRPVRADTIVRLAIALDAEPKAWLGLTGNGEMTATMVASLIVGAHELRTRAGSNFLPHGTDPVDFFRALSDRAKTQNLAMIGLYTSPPGGVGNDEIITALREALGRKLSIAMVIPFREKVGDSTPLGRYSRRVRAEVNSMWIQLSDAGTSETGYHRVAVFEPVDPCLQHAPITPIRFRPILLLNGDGPSQTKELHGWVHIPGFDDVIYTFGKSDSEEETEDASLALTLWADYAQSIIGGWNPTAPGWSPESLPAGRWKLNLR